MSVSPTTDGDPAVQLPLEGTTDPGTGRPAYNHQRALRFLQINRRLDEIGEEEKALKQERATLEEAMFAEIEDTGVTKFRVTDPTGQGYTFFVRREVRASALDNVAVVRWYQANGLASKVSVNPQTLSALVKDYLVARKVPLPEALERAVTVFDQHFIRTLKVK